MEKQELSEQGDRILRAAVAGGRDSFHPGRREAALSQEEPPEGQGFLHCVSERTHLPVVPLSATGEQALLMGVGGEGWGRAKPAGPQQEGRSRPQGLSPADPPDPARPPALGERPLPSLRRPGVADICVRYDCNLGAFWPQ